MPGLTMATSSVTRTCVPSKHTTSPQRMAWSVGTTTTNTPLLSKGKELIAAAAGSAVVLSAALSLSAPPALAFDVELGAQVFNGNCAACHTGGKNIVQVEKTLEKDALEKYLAGGFNVEAIKYQVENGKGGMPAWQDRLDEDEIDAVSNYVYQQALKNAW